MKKQMVVSVLAAILVSSGAFAEEKRDHYHAAIYVDLATGIAGTAYNFSTEEEAKAGALATCKKKSGKNICAPIITLFNHCIAAAWSPRDKRAFGGIAKENIKIAEAQAENNCMGGTDPKGGAVGYDRDEGRGDLNCKIVSSICTEKARWRRDALPLL